MADEKNKTRAQKVASGNSKPKAASKGKSNQKSKDLPVQIPVRLITSTVCIALFILFLVMFLNPEGALVILLMRFVLGLIGWVGFYVAIPSLLYLFVFQPDSALENCSCFIVFSIFNRFLHKKLQLF